jgi:hypothetical protein
MKPETKRAQQDVLIDAIVAGWLPNGNKAPSRPANARSLKPDVNLMIDCVEGSQVACAIRDAWAFDAPVTSMEKGAFDEMARRCYVVFSPEGFV